MLYSTSTSRDLTSLKKSSCDCLKLAKQWYSICVAISELLLFLTYSRSTRKLRWETVCAKDYENPTMLSRVTA